MGMDKNTPLPLKPIRKDQYTPPSIFFKNLEIFILKFQFSNKESSKIESKEFKSAGHHKKPSNNY